MMRLPLLFVTRAVQLRNPIPLHLTSVHGCILRKCHALPQNTQDIVSRNIATKPLAKFAGQALRKSSKASHVIGPVPTVDYQPSIVELEEIKKTLPNSKSLLLNCYSKVSKELKLNSRLQPAFKNLKKGKEQYWQASYHVKWPNQRSFSAIGKSRSEADQFAVLSALNWLKINGHLYPNGHPILYSSSELSSFMTNVRSPVQISIPEKLTEEMEALFEEYQTLEPLLVQDRIHNRSDNPTEMGKQSTTEMDEDEDFDPSYHQSASSPNEYSIENNETVFDPITGRHRRPIGYLELDRRDKELLESAHRRVNQGLGPKVPLLPIFEKKEHILEQIQKNRVVVLSGGTGCGKSTQVPQYLLDSLALDSRGSKCNIIVTQPRRLAALSLASTVAGYRGEEVGESVGYQVRLNSVMPRHRSGRILFCSTGILLRRLQTCPELNGISHLIIDEVHERDVLTDFLLVIIKDLLKKNVNLKVILMSASMNADLFSRYFDNAPLIHVNGRAFPVKEHFLADVLDFLPRGKQQQMNVKPIIDVDLVTRLICFIDKAKPVDGAILCFLPGWKDIKTIHSKLKDLYPSEETHWVLPVHSRLSQEEQKRIFDPPPPGIRKIVLATNIAETSITINDVVYVIDPGVHKQMSYNAQRGSAVIENQWVSKANVKQRAGRAGRVRAGESFHLFTEEQFHQMQQFPQPEIMQIPLEKVVMDVKAYNENLKAVDFLGRLLEPPPTDAIEDSIEELELIGALDKEERLTSLGRKIAPFTTHPRLAKALVYAIILRCVSPVVSIIAGLNASREPWDISTTDGRQKKRDAKREFHATSDHLALANLMSRFLQQSGSSMVNDFCTETSANPKTLYFLKGVRSLLVDHLCDADLLSHRSNAIDVDHPCNSNAANEEIVKAALLIGLSDRILRVQKGRIVRGAIKRDDVAITSE